MVEQDNSREVLGCLSSRIRHIVGSGMARYAHFCARRPWTSIGLSMLVVLATAPGIVFLDVRNIEADQYIRGSYSHRAFVRMQEEFPFNPKKTATFLYFVAKDERSLFEPEALMEAGRTVDRVLALTTEEGTRYEDLCEDSWRGRCEADSVFHSYTILQDVLGLNESTPAGMGKVEGLGYLMGNYCVQDPIMCKRMLAPQEGFLASERTEGTLDVVSLRVLIYLDPHRTERSGEKSYSAFQKVVMEEAHAPLYETGKDNFQTDRFHVINSSEFAILAEGSRPAAREGHLMGLTFGIIIIFVCCSIYAPQSPHSRIMLSFTCAVIVGLSLVSTVGVNGYFGVPFTSMTTLVIFTLFGVSVDDIIVLVHSYDRLPDPPHVDKVAENVAQSLYQSGAAITLTSATSLVAFMCAAFCPISSIRYFCISAACGVFFIFVYQITLFVPLFIMDERRRLRAQPDCCCSPFVPRPPLPRDDANDDRGCIQEERSENSSVSLIHIITAPSVSGGCGLVQTSARFLAKRRLVQAAVTIMFVVCVGFGVWGTMNAKTDQDLTSYYIDTSFIREYFRVNAMYYDARAPYYLVIDHQDEGLFDDAWRHQVDELYRDLADLDFTFDPEEHWLREFDMWLELTADVNGLNLTEERARLTGDARQFGMRVTEFLNAPQFLTQDGDIVRPWLQRRNVVFKDGVVKYSRLTMMYEMDFRVQARYIAHFHESLDLVFPEGPGQGFDNPRVPNTWAFTAMYPSAERDERMRMIIYENLLISGIAVMLSVMVILNPLVGIFVGTMVFALDAIVLALLTLYGNKLDFVAFLCLSMTIGLVVDYSTHTAHAYLHHKGTPSEKLYYSVSHMGASVLSGGGSTILGIIVLAFAHSPAFRAFFRVLGTAVAVGTFVGIMVSPLLLRVLHGLGIRALAWASRCRRSSTELPKATAAPNAATIAGFILPKAPGDDVVTNTV